MTVDSLRVVALNVRIGCQDGPHLIKGLGFRIRVRIRVEGRIRVEI